MVFWHSWIPIPRNVVWCRSRAADVGGGGSGGGQLDKKLNFKFIWENIQQTQ